MRVKGVRAKNFRCLTDLEIQFRPFTVIIGPNSAGKSTLLELTHLLSRQRSRGVLENAISRLGGFNATIWQLATEPIIQLGVDVGDENPTWKYDLTLRAERGSYFVERESLGFSDGGSPFTTFLAREDAQLLVSVNSQMSRRSATHGPAPSLPQCNEIFDSTVEFLNATERTSFWSVNQFQINDRTKGPQQLQPMTLPGKDGSDLISALYSIKTQRKSDFRELLMAIQTAIPELEEIEFPLAGAGHVNLTWKQSNLPRELYLSQLSDGTNRLLWLMTVLHAVPDDGLVLIDEPEISFHPQWLLLLVSIMRKISARTTVVVATQSPEIVRWVEPHELLIADTTDHGTRFSWADARPDIEGWLKEFTLDELWNTGELGGRR